MDSLVGHVRVGNDWHPRSCVLGAFECRQGAYLQLALSVECPGADEVNT
jgi:hypothetical protein